MIKIRLARHGKKNDAFYKIVAIEERRKREGKALDYLGYWHPASGDKKVDKKKIQEWVKKGAQITKGAAKLIEKS